MPISVNRPDESAPLIADLYVAFEGLPQLVRASHWIVEATLLEACPDPDGLDFPEFAVSVEHTYRGDAHEVMVVSGLHDRWGPAQPPEPGSNMVLFLHAPESPASERIWTVGGPQGYFPIVDGLVVRGLVNISPTLGDYGLAISAILDGEPPDYMPVPAVPLTVSPRGRDLPPPGSPIPSGCGGVLAPSMIYGESPALAVWSSQQAFVGEVVERLPSARAEVGDQHDLGFIRPIVTDYLVRVVTPIRGWPADAIRVRELGGGIEGCVLGTPDDDGIEPGRKFVIFASTPDVGAADPTYSARGGIRGGWHLTADGTFAVSQGDDYYPATIVPVSRLVRGLIATLNSPMPDAAEFWGTGRDLIPLDAAPVNNQPAEADATISPGPDWVTAEIAASGYRIAHPSEWTLLETGGVLTLANYATDGGAWESIPDGGLRIDVGLPGRPFNEFPTPITVGAPDYPGSIFFTGLSGDTYHVYVAYEAGGEYRQLAGYFRELPGLDNPNLLTFFAVIASIDHDLE